MPQFSREPIFVCRVRGYDECRDAGKKYDFFWAEKGNSTKGEPMRNGTLLICVIGILALCVGCEGSKKSSLDAKKESPKSQTKTGKFGSGKNEKEKAGDGKTDPVSKDTGKTNEGRKTDTSGGKTNVKSSQQLPDVAATTTAEPIESLDVASLINCLGDADSAKKLQAAQKLVSLGEPSIAELREALQAENYHVRAGAAFALGLFGTRAKEAAADLEQLSKEDQREAVRSAAAFALDSIQSEN